MARPYLAQVVLAAYTVAVACGRDPVRSPGPSAGPPEAVAPYLGDWTLRSDTITSGPNVAWKFGGTLTLEHGGRTTAGTESLAAQGLLTIYRDFAASGGDVAFTFSAQGTLQSGGAHLSGQSYCCANSLTLSQVVARNDSLLGSFVYINGRPSPPMGTFVGVRP